MNSTLLRCRVAAAMMVALIGAVTGPTALAAPAGPDFEVNTAADPGDGICDPIGTGDGCTLREAVAASNAAPDPSTITFHAALAGQTIDLSTVGDSTFGPSALAVTTEITLVGLSGNSGVTIARSNAVATLRLFHVSGSGNLTVRDLTLANGRARGGNGAVVPATGGGGEGGGGGGAGLGGAIFNEGRTAIERSTLVGNAATGGNGGASVCSSSAGSGGGGLNGDGSPGNGGSAGGANGGGAGSVTGNPGDSGGFGGGGGGGSFFCDTGGCFGRDGGPGGFGGGGGGGGGFNNPGIDGGLGGFGAGNGGEAGQACGGAGGGGGAGLGGALFNHGGSVSLVNSTVSDNRAQGGSGGNGVEGIGGDGGSGFGGGVFNLNGIVFLTNSTLADNEVAGGASGGGGGNGSAGGAAGGAVYNLAHEAATYSNGTIAANNAILFLGSTILADSTGPSDLANERRAQTADVNASSPNIVETPIVNVGGGSVDASGVQFVDPALGPLGSNGGPTRTHALRDSSPAIDQGNSFGSTTDQRGFPRPLDDAFVADAFDGSDIGAYETCCNDRNPCTTDTCNPTTGACTFAPDDGAACTDDDACTTDACVSGACRSTPTRCDDGSGCTTDTCDPGAGCVFTPDEQGTCTDGNPCTLDVCVNGVCSTVCPVGFTPVSGGCQKTYDIDETLLDNQTNLCLSENYYNECNGAEYGFHWLDDPTIPGVVRLDVALQAGITCSPGNVSTTSLNGTLVGSFSQPGDCACTTPSFTVSQSDLDTSAYQRGVLNFFSIQSFGCEGLSNNGPFGPGLFARASVTYGPIFLGCDDGNPCTDDSCDPATGCVHAPNDAACDDGDTCTTGDACSAGSCGGTPLPCDDDNPCTIGEQCTGGTCAGGTQRSCDDGNPCTDDSCNPQSQATDPCVHAPNTASCDDGNRCTTGDACNAGICAGGATRSCDDGNPCTDDSCNPQSQATDPCVHAPNTRPCNDGNPCTTDDACGNGTCTGEAKRCAPPTDLCHFPGTCEPSTGACVYAAKPDGTACTDNNACTAADACRSGVCRSGAAVTCAPPDSCHNAATCNPSTGCVYPAKPNGTSCSDGSACTTNDKCQSGTCIGTPKTCTAPDSCHDATCNPASGSCSYPAKPNGAACNDGNACTTGDSCQSGTCRSTGTVTCVAPDSCHTAMCSTTTGTCSYPAKSNGTSCNDGSACTTNDKCQSGTCTGTPKTCTPPDACHDATCNPSTGACAYPAKAEGASCSDGNACTTGDACRSGACRSTGTVTCPAPDSCHNQGACNSSTGVCSNPSKPNGTACNDGDPCTTQDTCKSGACSGTAPACPAGAGSIEADTTVRERSSGQNFGSSRELEATGSAGSRSVTLVRVRVTGGGTVTHAKLRLVVAGASGSSAGTLHTVPCNRWTELGATWSNRPQPLGPVIDTQGTFSYGQAVDFDVSSVIHGDGTYCFGIDNGSSSYRFNSRESISGGRPVLLLECACSP